MIPVGMGDYTVIYDAQIYTVIGAVTEGIAWKIYKKAVVYYCLRTGADLSAPSLARQFTSFASAKKAWYSLCRGSSQKSELHKALSPC
jgi:hypothetical protein